MLKNQLGLHNIRIFDCFQLFDQGHLSDGVHLNNNGKDQLKNFLAQIADYLMGTNIPAPPFLY